MVEHLKQHPDVAKGFCKGQQSSIWQKLARELNSLGPPIKDPTGWKKVGECFCNSKIVNPENFPKVWFDYKSQVKRKLAKNKKEMNTTGGGPCKLMKISDVEEQVIQLAGINDAVQGIKNTRSFGVPSPLPSTSAPCPRSPPLPSTSASCPRSPPLPSTSTLSTDPPLPRTNTLSTDPPLPSTSTPSTDPFNLSSRSNRGRGNQTTFDLLKLQVEKQINFYEKK